MKVPGRAEKGFRLVTGIGHLQTWFINAGLRSPVAIVLVSQEEVDQLSYLLTGLDASHPDTRLRPTTTVYGIEIRVEGGDKVSE